MHTKQAQFILAIALQIAAILSIIMFKVLILKNTTEVMLKVQPVDPRDWLRGDYVTLQ